MKKPTDEQLERLARRIFMDCRPLVNGKHPGRWLFEWEHMEEVTRFGWRMIAKWHLEHKGK